MRPKRPKLQLSVNRDVPGVAKPPIPRGIIVARDSHGLGDDHRRLILPPLTPEQRAKGRVAVKRSKVLRRKR